MEKQFLGRFFEDDTEISIHNFLTTKKEEDEIVKSFIERFGEKSMWWPHGMSQETLAETCKHNFKTSVLIKMEAVKSRTWKDLIKQGEHART